VLLGVCLPALPPPRQTELALRENTAGAGDLALQPEQALVAKAEPMPLPDVSDRRGRHADPDEPQVL